MPDEIQTTACIGDDPGCPCQDGLACHYRPAGDSPAWPLPEPDILDIGRAADHLENYIESQVGGFYDYESCQRVVMWLRRKERVHYGR